MTNEEFEKRVVIARAYLNDEEIQWMNIKNDSIWKDLAKNNNMSFLFNDYYKVRLKPKPVYEEYNFETASQMMHKVVYNKMVGNRQYTIVGYTQAGFVIFFDHKYENFPYNSALYHLIHNDNPVGILCQ